MKLKFKPATFFPMLFISMGLFEPNETMTETGFTIWACVMGILGFTALYFLLDEREKENMKDGTEKNP